MIDFKDAADDATLRANGRKIQEVRAIKIQFGVLKSAKGSALF